MFRLNTTLAITVRSSGTVFAISTQHQARVTTQLATSTSRTVRMNRLHLQHKVELDLQVLPQPVTRHSCHSMPSTYHVIYSVHRDFFGISRVFWLLRLINTLYLLTQGISKTDHKFHLHITCPYYIFPANSYITPHCTETAISLSDNRRQKSYGTITLSTPVQLQKNLSFRHKMD